MRCKYNYVYWFRIVTSNGSITGDFTSKYPIKCGADVLDFQNYYARENGLNENDLQVIDFKLLRKKRVG